jgi:hypothetical protein
MQRIRAKIILRACVLVLIILTSLTVYKGPPGSIPWQQRLYTPTSIINAGDIFIIIDCWHHRALWSQDLAEPVSRWKTFDDDLAGPHSVATNGDIFVIDDTERGAVRAYRRIGSQMQLVQKVEGLGGRTHRVHYSREQQGFYVLSSGLNTITKLTLDAQGLLKIAFSKKLHFLGPSYTRSFSLYGDYAYFVSGPGKITQTLIKDDSFSVVQHFDVAPELHSMNDVFYSGKYWYVTATPQRIVRVKDLSLLALTSPNTEDMFPALGLRGTPYYISSMQGRIFVPQISEYSGLVSFVEHDDKVTDLKVHFDFGPPSPKSVQRKLKYIR